MIIVISGPTASGKSALALNLGEFKNIAIINADALQLYDGLPILSAQPSVAEQKKIPHYLYSCLKPNDSASAGMWLRLVKSKVDQVTKENKTPVIVGGTGMYISRLFDGIVKIPDVDEALKIKARELFLEIGPEEFKKILIEKNHPKEKIEKLDKQRLIRAYEVYLQTGKTVFYYQDQKNEFIFDPKTLLHVNLEIDREILYNNCNLRFDTMLENGAIEEVRALIENGVIDNSQITKTLGFEEIKDFLTKKIPLEQAKEIAAQKTRNYAKRQLTWFRNQFENKNIFNNIDAALVFLKKYNHEI